MTIIWSNGCFDVLHRGHVEMLNYARSLGDFLIIGVDSDVKVLKDKGPGRPVYTFDDRKYMLESLEAVDVVFGFDSPKGLSSLISKVAPDVMVVGEEYRDRTVIGGEFTKEIYYFGRIDGYATSILSPCFVNR